MNQGNRGCYIHTNSVQLGNLADKHYCWVFGGGACPSLVHKV